MLRLLKLYFVILFFIHNTLCEDPSGDISNLHSDDTAECSWTGEESDETKIYKDRILFNHNKTRTRAKNVLAWDDDLAAAALIWAKQCHGYKDKSQTVAYQNTIKRQQVKTNLGIGPIVFAWSNQPNNPANDKEGVGQSIGRYGCGIFRTKHCFEVVDSTIPCIYTFYVVCNYA